MRSALRFLTLCLCVLPILILASPGFAQSLPAEGDPFAGVSAVAGIHMSSVSGQPGATGLPGNMSPENGTECGTACGSDSAARLATPVTMKVKYGSSSNVRVTAINNQTSIIGTAVIDASGGGN
jgi:hypothetical protein